MRPLNDYFAGIEKELRELPTQFLLGRAKNSIYGFEMTGDFEHLQDLYFAAISLVIKESDFDSELLELVDDDLYFLYFYLN